MTRILARLAAVSLVLGGTAACSDESGPREAMTNAPLAGAAGAGAASVAGGGGSSSGAGGVGGVAGSSVLDAPDSEEPLVVFLQAKQYATWAKEGDYHKSTGPHGDAVRVYYSPKAAAAVKTGAATLPTGAAVVKELTSGGSLYGYAVWVKVQDASEQGNGFFWYERINQGGGAVNIYGNARGSSDCVGCHAAGKDYNLSTLAFD
jgi:hypothetical protein